MAVFTPPPTYAQVVLYDENARDEKELIKTARFNPIWLKWFVDLAALLPGGGVGLGTVTSIAESFTGGLITVGGSPITTSGTLALTVAGTSGGVPYFSTGTTWASSAALGQYGVVVGGGAGAAPVTITAGTANQFLKGAASANPAFGAATLASADFANQGTTTTVLHGNAAGNPSFGKVALAADVSGLLPSANGGADAWAAFTPARTGWTDVGSPTVTGSFCKVGGVCFFQVKVVPGTTTATVAGTSYVGLPATATGIGGDGSMMNLTSLVGVGNCVIDSANSRVYVPTQGATGNTLTIGGWFQV